MGDHLFRAVIVKFGAGITAAASVLALSVLSAPAFATSAPARTQGPCDPYPAEVVTHTSLSLSRAVGEYGARNVAVARVSASAGGFPPGKVAFHVAGIGSYIRTLNPRGVASLVLPARAMVALNTYRIRSFYTPVDCAGRASSASPARYYSVYPAGTSTGVLSPHASPASLRPGIHTVNVEYFPTNNVKRSSDIGAFRVARVS